MAGRAAVPLKQRTERARIANAIFIEAKVIQEQDERPLRVAQQDEKLRQTGKFVYRALQQGNVLPFPLELTDDGSNDRRLAGSSRTPQQHVMGPMTGCMAAAVFQQRLLLRVDAGQQRIIHRCERLHRTDRRPIPHIGGRGCQIGGRSGRRRDPFQRFGNAGQQGVVHGAFA